MTGMLWLNMERQRPFKFDVKRLNMFSKNSLFKITHSSRVVLKKLTPFNKLNRNKEARPIREKERKQEE